MALIASAVKKRDFTRAMKSIDGLEKKQPDNPLVHALRGAVFVAKGDIAAGRASLEKALSLKPAYFPAAASLANFTRALERMGGKMAEAPAGSLDAWIAQRFPDARVVCSAVPEVAGNRPLYTVRHVRDLDDVEQPERVEQRAADGGGEVQHDRGQLHQQVADGRH